MKRNHEKYYTTGKESLVEKVYRPNDTAVQLYNQDHRHLNKKI